MGRIVVLANPLDSDDKVEHTFSGPFIDWLQVHYPNGFETPHVASFNLKRLPVEDYDTVIGEDDVLVLGIFPAAPAFFAVTLGMGAFWGGVASFVVGTVISIGLSYAINALFGPKGASPTAPRAQGSTPAAGSVYSMSIPTNTARIGQPIPAVYGKNILVPDLAAAPYAFYAGNEQYVDQILCLGHGEFEIEEVKVAATNVAELPAGIVSWYQIPSSWHQQTFGVIQRDTGILENVYTSPEVSDQLFYAASGGVFTCGLDMWNACFIECEDEGVTGNFWLSTEAAEYAEALRNGRSVYMQIASGPNVGTWDMGYLVNSGNTGKRALSWMYRRGYINGYFDENNTYVAQPTWFGSGSSTVTLTYTRPGSEVEGGPIGPFAASPPCMLTEHLQYDVVWPGGCYTLDDSGALNYFAVEGTFVAELIDNTGAALGPSYTYNWYERLNSNTPQRRTYDHWVPKGRYRVTGARTSAKSDRGQDRSDCLWVGLKSILGVYCEDTGIAEVPTVPDSGYLGGGAEANPDDPNENVIFGQTASGTWYTLGQEMRGEVTEALFVPSLADYHTAIFSNPGADRESYWGCGPDTAPGVDTIGQCDFDASLRGNVTYMMRLPVTNGAIPYSFVRASTEVVLDGLGSYIFALSKRPDIQLDLGNPEEIDELCRSDTPGLNYSFYKPQWLGGYYIPGCSCLDPSNAVLPFDQLYIKWKAVGANASQCGDGLRCAMYIVGW